MENYRNESTSLIDRLISWWKEEPVLQERAKSMAEINASSGSYGSAYMQSYDGEKNLGAIGGVVEYYLDFQALRLRSWDAYLTSDIAKTILNKLTIWTIDEGLKLQANPSKLILESEGLNIDTEKFNENVEARFGMWATSRSSSFSGMENLNNQAKDAFKNAKVGGDVLVVLRLNDDNVVTVDLVDGAHIQDPYFGSKAEKGNTIHQGIEVDETGRHIAYHVRTKDFKSERIVATSKATGLTVAFMVYGNKYRLNNYRGVPVIATSLETIAKLDRYKEAAVGSAEERQKIAYAIEHEFFSSGESPLASQMASAFDASVAANSKLPKDAEGEQMANTVAATTDKMTFNMPRGAHLKSLESRNEMFFKDFYGTLAETICSSVGIPPNVAFSIYNDSFSASRTATKDWEHTMTVERKDFSFQFYQPIYAFWLHIEILKLKVQAPGYLAAAAKKDTIILESYRKARFTGTMFPHIDPLKEVKAEREKLGTTGESIPLTTVEAATEALNGGDSKSNMEQYSKELKDSKALDIKIDEVVPVASANPGQD